MTVLDNKEFAEAIQSQMPIAIDFWAGWCMPCKIFAPVLEELSKELDGKISFAKIDIDEFGDVAQEYAISSIPTVIVFKEGQVLERFVGVQPKAAVKNTLEGLL